MSKKYFVKNNRNKILIIIGLLFLFCLTTYYTYAYFTDNIVGNEEAKSVEVTTGTLLLEYKDKEGTLVSVYNAMPGVSASKEFTVKNVGTLDASYDILWKDVVNNFADKTDLYYTLTCSTDNADGECREVNSSTQMPNTTSNQEIVKSIDIKVGETHTYKLEVSFPNKDEDQNDNQGKSITANVQIVQFSEPTITMDVQDGVLDKASSIVDFGGSDTFTVTPNTGYYLENMNVSCNYTNNITIVDNEITIGPIYLSNACNITFTPSYDIHGYVVDQNNDPVSNATVEVHSSVRTAVTDATGYFELNSVITGDHELKVIQNTNTLHDSNFKIQKNHEFNIAGNTITAVNTTDPIKIKITLNSSSNKTIEVDNTYRVMVSAVNGNASKTLDIVESGNSSNINITPNEGYNYANTTCTNGVNGVWNNNTLSIDSVDKDTACTVGFGAQTYELSMNTHNTAGVLYKNVVYDTVYGELPSQTKEYYNFNGWFTLEIGGSEITSETIVSTASNHTIHAQYSPKNYDVVYNCTENGGTCSIANESVTYGASIDLTKTASKENYTFIGWNIDSNATVGLSSLVMNTAGKTLYAIYEKTINVTYNSNGSTLSKLSDSCTIYNNASECTFTSPTITRENYHIIGFNEDSSLTTSTLNRSTSYTISSSKTYYAITYEALAPTITLGSNSNTTYAKSGSVTVTVSDNISGLKVNQGLKYGWSTSNTVEPSSYTNVTLSNTVGATSTTFTASSTNELTGQYYLWVLPNTSVCDTVNNCNTTTVVSTGLFYFDNTGPSITNVEHNILESTINIIVTASDNDSGINNYYYGYGINGSCDGVTYLIDSNSSYTYTNIPDGTYSLCVYSSDHLANNSSIYRIDDAEVITSYVASYVTNSSYSLFEVPVTGYYQVELWGAQGGSYDTSYDGGLGSYTKGTIYMNKGEKYYVYTGGVGGANAIGYNGGGNAIYMNGTSYGGGGATDIRFFGDTEPTQEDLDWNSTLGLTSRIMCAGGGGGGAKTKNWAGSGGDSGIIGLIGQSTYTSGTNIGTGGTQTSAGYATVNSTATIGGFGYGGIAGDSGNGGGGGGSGWYGGGGGYGYSGGGGGGSSYISGYAGVNSVSVSSTSVSHTNNTLSGTNKYFINASISTSSKTNDGSNLITYLGSTLNKTSTSLNGVRYIKDCISGANTVDSQNRWVEIQAIYNGSNIAYGLTPTGTSVENSSYPYSRITDGIISSDSYAVPGTSGTQCITIDLQQEYDLDEISIWHYYKDSRRYTSNITSVSSDNSNWSEVINKSIAETSTGKRVNSYKTESDIDNYFTYTGTYIVQQSSTTEWKIKFTSSGTLTFTKALSVDAFLVGGGGGGGRGHYINTVGWGGSGGGGGYTTTSLNKSLTANTAYTIQIGGGGGTDSNGGSTTAFGLTASGGYGGTWEGGGNGGSGGGSGGYLLKEDNSPSNGGAYGNNGGVNCLECYGYGNGQGTTTCEFGEGSLDGCNSGVTPYSGGGGGGAGAYESTMQATFGYGGTGGGGTGGKTTGYAATPNTGGGGGGGGALNNQAGGSGGSGIVIIRSLD